MTEKKSKELIEKLCDQCSIQDAGLVRRDVRVSGRVKSMNASIYYNIDAIQDAISQGKQISFRYFDWGIDGQRHYREKTYSASPYGLCQDSENCYLLAWSQRHGITSYRIDRMSHIQILPENRIPCPELTGAAFNEHANRLFQMYSGEIVNVKMQFEKDFANVVIDRFGKDTMLIPEPDGIHFNFTVPVALSPMFFSWLIGFGDKARILYPQKAIDACKELCREVLTQY